MGQILISILSTYGEVLSSIYYLGAFVQLFSVTGAVFKLGLIDEIFHRLMFAVRLMNLEKQFLVIAHMLCQHVH